MKFLLLITTILCILYRMNSDIPVHCTKSQIVGEWEFKATEPTKKGIEELYQHTCGHKNPSHEDSSYKFNMDMKTFTDLFTVKFEETDKMTININKESHVGKWTMVYDEGFDFSFGENKTFFVFSKYDHNDRSNEKITSKWASYCYTTLIGWYQLEDKYGCFYGTKQGKSGKEATNGEAENKQVVVEGSMTTKSLLQTNENPEEVVRFMQSKFSEKLELNSNFKDHGKVVERINSENGSWKAENYEEFQGLTILDLNRLAGRKKSRTGKLADFSFNFKEKKSKNTFPKSVYSLLKTEKDNSLSNKFLFKRKLKYSRKNKIKREQKEEKNEEKNEEFEKEFSWKEYMSHPKSQGSCGSCFALATLTMIEARFRIKYKQTLQKLGIDPLDFKLSIQHILKCSVYNQGCDGGYSYLVSKFLHQFEVYPDKCFKNEGKCHQTCDDPKYSKLKIGIKDYYYVGGSYGKTNERNLMKDLKNNGPVVISLEPEYTFMMYKSGVYDVNNEKNWFTQNLTKPEWQKVDHSVVLVGWGEEEDKITKQPVKYWLVQNSWGSHWGEQGYIKIKRGIDLSGIESIGEAAIPILK